MWEAPHTWKRPSRLSNQKQTIDERGLLPRTSMGKNAIGSTQGKETKRERKVLSNSQVTVTRSKAVQTSTSFFLPSPLGFRQVDPHAKFACSMFALIVALEFILFFPSNARWLSPGRLASRKDNCSLQIHRINAVATSVMTTMCIQKGTE